MSNFDQSFALKLRFMGGKVESNGLNLYDGSASFHGFSKGLQIILHAFLNDQIVSRAPALKGGSLSFSAPRRGSVIFDIVAKFSKKPKTAPLNAATFYDFIRLALERATGNYDTIATSSFVENRLDTDEPFFDELAEKLEGCLQQAHRSVDNEGVIVSLERPKSTLIVFDKNTSEWVNIRDENPSVEEFIGNMTRFNTLTGNGRAYIQGIGKIVPVRKSEGFKDSNKGNLTWSLHGSNTSRQKDLTFVGRKIESARGETKRIVIDDCLVHG